MKVSTKFLRELKTCNALSIDLDKGVINLLAKSNDDFQTSGYPIKTSSSGYWIMPHYPDIEYNQSTIFGLLRIGDYVFFDITETPNHYAREADLAVKQLIISIKRYRYEKLTTNLTFCLDTQIFPREAKLTKCG